MAEGQKSTNAMKQTGPTSTPVNSINKPVVNTQPSQYFNFNALKFLYSFIFEVYIVFFLDFGACYPQFSFLLLHNFWVFVIAVGVYDINIACAHVTLDYDFSFYLITFDL